MQRVICRLPNAGHLINDVRFASMDGGGMLSEEIPDHIAEQFCAIEGYELWVKPTETRPNRNEPRSAAKET